MNPQILEELRKESSYLQLTDKQKIFVEAYVVKGGDQVEAALKAYDCKSRASARAIAYTQMGDIRIIMLLNKYVGGSSVTREQLLALLWREVNRKGLDPRWKVPMFNQIERLSGFSSDKTPPPTAIEIAIETSTEDEADLTPASFLSKYDEVTTHE